MSGRPAHEWSTGTAVAQVVVVQVVWSFAAPVSIPNILGQHTNPKMLSDASECEFVWTLDRNTLNIEKSTCVNNGWEWANEACCIMYFEWSSKVEKRYKGTSLFTFKKKKNPVMVWDHNHAEKLSRYQ